MKNRELTQEQIECVDIFNGAIQLRVKKNQCFDRILKRYFDTNLEKFTSQCKEAGLILRINNNIKGQKIQNLIELVHTETDIILASTADLMKRKLKRKIEPGMPTCTRANNKKIKNNQPLCIDDDSQLFQVSSVPVPEDPWIEINLELAAEFTTDVRIVEEKIVPMQVNVETLVNPEGDKNSVSLERFICQNSSPTYERVYNSRAYSSLFFYHSVKPDPFSIEIDSNKQVYQSTPDNPIVHNTLMPAESSCHNQYQGSHPARTSFISDDSSQYEDWSFLLEFNNEKESTDRDLEEEENSINYFGLR